MCGPLAAFSTSSAPCVIPYAFSPSSSWLRTLSQCQRIAFLFILKLHVQFQAPSWKSLVLKICRGAYPPLPGHLPYELQFLVKQIFKTNPKDRPSVRTILTSHRVSRLLRARLPSQVKTHSFVHAWLLTMNHMHALSQHHPLLRLFLDLIMTIKSALFKLNGTCILSSLIHAAIILLPNFSSRQKNEGGVQADGTEMRGWKWQRFWERKVWWKNHLKVELSSKLMVCSWIKKDKPLLNIANVKVLVPPLGCHRKPKNRDAESSGLSLRTACCRSWQTPASSHQTVSHLVEVRLTLAHRFFKESFQSAGVLRLAGGACGELSEKEMGSGSSGGAAETAGDGSGEQSLQHVYNKERRFVHIWNAGRLVGVIAVGMGTRVNEPFLC